MKSHPGAILGIGITEEEILWQHTSVLSLKEAADLWKKIMGHCHSPAIFFFTKVIEDSATCSEETHKVRNKIRLYLMH